MNLEKEIAWDLTELFPGSNHPKIAQKQKELQEMAENLVLKYKGKINNQNFSANDLLKLFQEEEKFFEEFSELRSFSELNFSANMTIPENQELHTKITNFLTDLQKKIVTLAIKHWKKNFTGISALDISENLDKTHEEILIEAGKLEQLGFFHIRENVDLYPIDNYYSYERGRCVI